MEVNVSEAAGHYKVHRMDVCWKLEMVDLVQWLGLLVNVLGQSETSFGGAIDCINCVLVQLSWVICTMRMFIQG